MCNHEDFPCCGCGDDQPYDGYDEPEPYDGGGWAGDGSGTDDFADMNANEADDYRDEGAEDGADYDDGGGMEDQCLADTFED